MISQFDEASQFSGRLVKRQVPTKNVFGFFKLMNTEVSNQRFLNPHSICMHMDAILFFSYKENISSCGFKCFNSKALVFLKRDGNQVTFLKK